MKTDKTRRFLQTLEEAKYSPTRFSKDDFHEVMCELHGFHISDGLWFAPTKDSFNSILIIKVGDWRETSSSSEVFFQVVDFSIIPMNSFASAIVAISGNTNNYEAILNILKGNEPEREGKDIQKIWDEACEAQMKEVYDAIPAGSGDTNAHAIKHWTKKPQCPYNSNFKQNNNG